MSLFTILVLSITYLQQVQTEGDHIIVTQHEFLNVIGTATSFRGVQCIQEQKRFKKIENVSKQ